MPCARLQCPEAICFSAGFAHVVFGLCYVYIPIYRMHTDTHTYIYIAICNCIVPPCFVTACSASRDEMAMEREREGEIYINI